MASLEELYGDCYKKKKKSKKSRSNKLSACDTYARQYSKAMKTNNLDNQFYVNRHDASNHYAQYNREDYRPIMDNRKRVFESQSEQPSSRYMLRMDKAHDKDTGIGYYDPAYAQMETFVDDGFTPPYDREEEDDFEPFSNNAFDANRRTGSADTETDYFDKLYKGHEFGNMESRNGLNIMRYRKSGSQTPELDDQDNALRDPDVDVESNPAPIQPSTQLRVPDDHSIIQYQKDKYYMDFGLYLISGILLIFILEQFVQLGMTIRQARLESRNAVVYDASPPAPIYDEPALSL